MSDGWLNGACIVALYRVPRDMSNSPSVVHFNIWWASRSAR